MPSANCLENIRKEPEPFNRACTPAGCQKVFDGTQSHCQGKKQQDGTPVMSYDDNLFGPGKGGICYCCCSCVAYGTLIEKTVGHYVPAEQVKKGDHILAAGLTLQWAPKQVTFDVGFLTAGAIDFVHVLRVEYPQEPSGFRELTVTQDHLFLRADGKLIAVQDINAGDQLRRADGGQAGVIFRVNGSYTGGIHSIELGPFVGNDLDGHLINCFGIVSTDYSVQAAYASGDQAVSELIVGDDLLAARTADEQRASGDPDALAAFLDDQGQWPQGFVPAGGSLVNIPKNARSFFTAGQAGILLAELEFDSPTNLVASSMVDYLFSIAATFYPDPTYILDWDNDLPNAYAFRRREQTFIVINGGLARIKLLNRNGMALVLGAMIAHTLGSYCVGEADYYGVADVMRLMWNAELFGNAYVAATQQIGEIFAELPDNGTNVDTCAEPSTSCRLSAYRAGLMLAPVPECARGDRDPFGLRAAIAADDLDSVTLFFTEMVEEITGSRKANYKLTGGARVVSAAVEVTDPAAVRLGVARFEPDTEYTVTASNVTSATGRPLAGDATTAQFRTGPAPAAAAE
jgi:hypothetical protein